MKVHRNGDHGNLFILTKLDLYIKNSFQTILKPSRPKISTKTLNTFFISCINLSSVKKTDRRNDFHNFYGVGKDGRLSTLKCELGRIGRYIIYPGVLV